MSAWSLGLMFSLAWSQALHGELPAADAPAAWISADPACPASRALLRALMHVDGRTVPVIAVGSGEAPAWAALHAELPELIVVHDPDGSIRRERVPWDMADRHGTVSLYQAGERIFHDTPGRPGDATTRAVATFLADPSEPPSAPTKGYSTVELQIAYAFGSRRAMTRVGKYMLRRGTADPWVLHDVARDLLLLEAPSRKEQKVARKLLDASLPSLPSDEPLLADTLARLERQPLPERVPATSVRGEALADDLTVLQGWIERYYSGVVDFEERLGGDLVAAFDAARAEARTQETWPWDAAADLVLNLLLPMNDGHFHLWEPGEGRLDRWLGDDGYAYFSDLVLDAEGAVVEGPEGWVGQVLDLPELPSDPAEVVSEAVVRFPSIAADGSARFLVGTMVIDGATPAEISVDGELLPVHPPRSRRPERPEAAWALVDDGDVPVLAVSTMRVSELDGMAATSPGLRAAPRVIVDLRANSGGSDSPAMEWVQGFSGGAYPFPNLTYKRSSGWFAVINAPMRVQDTPVYPGELFALMDKGTCSSGETFALLADAVPGGRLVGENSSGCVAQGNTGPIATLAHTGLRVSFGTSAFFSMGRPAIDGVGILPDLWLDVEDPVAFLRALAAPQPS